MNGRLDNQIIRKGMWWIKGNEEKKFVGILKYGRGYAPTLEIFPKEYEFRKQLVPNGSIVYGDVFWDSRILKAVTLLDCRSRSSLGRLTVGAYIYKHEFVYANCVAIGLLLDDSEIAQVKSPQSIFLTCPGLDEYSMANAIDYVWKDNIPKGRAYRINDLDKIVYTQPEAIEIDIDIGKISISLGQSSTARDLSSQYSIHISLEDPEPETKVNALIYSQWLSFLSIMTGRMVHIERHSIEIDSNQTRPGRLSIELDYGHIAHSPQGPEYSILYTLLLGNEKNMRKFATLFPKWRENFVFVEDLAWHYLRMVDQPTETNLLQAFPIIESYVLERLLGKNKKGMQGILEAVINKNSEHFQNSEVHTRHFPANRIEYLAEQLANYRHNRIHPKSEKECGLSFDEIYSYINVILRLLFLREMGYSYSDVDSEISHWRYWREIERE